jgi:uncharacterized membrane protein YccF (DUF307 family)
MSSQFSFLGVPVTLRPTAGGAGLLSSLVVALLTRNKGLSLAAGALWYSADAAHVAGHIISSELVGAPLDGIDFGLYPQSVYHNHDVTPQQHIGRAAGGVVASLLAVLLIGWLARHIDHAPAKQLLRISAAQNALLLVISLLPVPMVDGGVIYANLRKL